MVLLQRCLSDILSGVQRRGGEATDERVRRADRSVDQYARARVPPARVAEGHRGPCRCLRAWNQPLINVWSTFESSPILQGLVLLPSAWRPLLCRFAFGPSLLPNDIFAALVDKGLLGPPLMIQSSFNLEMDVEGRPMHHCEAVLLVCHPGLDVARPVMFIGIARHWLICLVSGCGSCLPTPRLNYASR